MKFNQHFHLYSRLMVVAVLAMIVFALQKSVDTRAEVTPDFAEIDGWAWNPDAGWVSLNCLNDFDGDQELENSCTGTDYGLTLETNAGQSYIRGCAWGGSAVGGSTMSLGWICFSDPCPVGDPSCVTYALDDGVPIDPDYINALRHDPIVPTLDYYASILSLTSTPASWDAYKLGFPIQTATTTPTGPIKGCVNCYTEYTYHCDIDGGPCSCANGAASCTHDDCDPVGDPLQSQLCVVTSTAEKCDNCVQYDYYQGRCSISTGVSCINNDDCPTSETCEPISTCSENIDRDCTDQPLNCDDPANCTERPIDSLKRTTGGFSCSACTVNDFDNDIEINAYSWNNNICNTCATGFYTPGVIFENNNGYIGSCEQMGSQQAGCDGITPQCDIDQLNTQADDFCERVHLGGWAWNSWNTGPPYNLDLGLGWFHFSPRITTSTRPYFSVERGSIYSGSHIFGRYAPPQGRYNASYLIEAGGTITNFVSEITLGEQDQQGEIGNRPWTINFLKPLGTHYANALGFVDYLGLIYTFDAGPPIKNKYGSEIVQFDPTDPGEPNDSLISILNDDPGDPPLGGQIFYASSTGQASTNLILPAGTPLKVKIGSGADRGSGIIIVDGNLEINSNITYETGAVSNLLDIPSLVWIVRGDVTIDPSVTKISGTFIVLGNGGAGSGQFSSGDGNTQLEIMGNVLARRFNLERTWYDTASLEPAELFINDGRLQANPPPGLTDFSRAVPRFSETVH